jgi:hypothetical protein
LWYKYDKYVNEVNVQKTKSVTATKVTHNKHSVCVTVDLNMPSIVFNQKGPSQTFY